MELLLDSQELLNLGTMPRNTQLFCRSGTCWLTLSGDARDHLLRQGQQFTSRQRGHLLVTALVPCRLEVRLQQGEHPCWQRLFCSATAASRTMPVGISE